MLVGLTLTGCSSQLVMESPVPSGRYRVRTTGQVVAVEAADTLRILPEATPQAAPTRPPMPRLVRHSLDVDLLTMPFKLRASRHSVPPQLNTSLNANLYLGYRTDLLRPGDTRRPYRHFGGSIGLFSGFGNSFISPTTTGNQYAGEYDGVVWQKGLGAIFAISKVAVGVGVGFDTLLDENRRSWIYDDAAWLGLVLTINLN